MLLRDRGMDMFIVMSTFDDLCGIIYACDLCTKCWFDFLNDNKKL